MNVLNTFEQNTENGYNGKFYITCILPQLKMIQILIG